MKTFGDLFRFDGWSNMLSGLGIKGKDKRKSAEIDWCRMEESLADFLYAADDVMSRIVDQLPNDATREGWEWQGDQKDSIKKKWDSLATTNKVLDAWIKGRQYGGAALLYLTKSMNLETPMTEGEEVTGFVALSRWELFAGSDLDTDLASPNFGYPIWYEVQTPVAGAALGVRVHHTRLERFHGVKLPRRLFIVNGYWHDSVMNKLLNPVRNYQISHDAVAAMIQDFNVGVWKMKNLADLVGRGKKEEFKDRVEIANYAKSVTRSIILDQDESYEDKARNVTGLPELLTKVGERLVAATNIPHTILLGQSPQGSNATGNSTVMSWYDYVASQQETYLKAKLVQIASRLGFPDADLEFKPLWQMDDKELTEVRNKQAQTDEIYIKYGVADASEIAVSRFGGEKYSLETEIENPESKVTKTPTSAAPGAKTDDDEETDPDPDEDDGEDKEAWEDHAYEFDKKSYVDKDSVQGWLDANDLKPMAVSDMGEHWRATLIDALAFEPGMKCIETGKVGIRKLQGKRK